MFIYHENAVRSRGVFIVKDHVKSYMKHHRNHCLLKVLLKTHWHDLVARMELLREIGVCEEKMSRAEAKCHGRDHEHLREQMIAQTAEFRSHI